MICETCDGDGLEFDFIERGPVTCSACGGTGQVPDPKPVSCFERRSTLGVPAVTMTCSTEE